MQTERSPYRALVADDEDVFCKLLAKTLTQEGLAVDTASDGMEAIERIESRRYDVILTDLMMPRAGGLEVLRAARRVDPDVAVILVTGYASLDSALAAIKEGAYDYITKPFQLEEIRLTVSNALEKRRLLEQNKELVDNLEAAYRQIQDLMVKLGKHAAGGATDIDSELAERQQRIYNQLQSLRTLRGASGSPQPEPETQKKTNERAPDLSRRIAEPAPSGVQGLRPGAFGLPDGH